MDEITINSTSNSLSPVRAAPQSALRIPIQAGTSTLFAIEVVFREGKEYSDQRLATIVDRFNFAIKELCQNYSGENVTFQMKNYGFAPARNEIPPANPVYEQVATRVPPSAVIASPASVPATAAPLGDPGGNPIKPAAMSAKGGLVHKEKVDDDSLADPADGHRQASEMHTPAASHSSEAGGVRASPQFAAMQAHFRDDILAALPKAWPGEREVQPPWDLDMPKISLFDKPDKQGLLGQEARLEGYVERVMARVLRKIKIPYFDGLPNTAQRAQIFDAIVESEEFTQYARAMAKSEHNEALASAGFNMNTLNSASRKSAIARGMKQAVKNVMDFHFGYDIPNTRGSAGISVPVGLEKLLGTPIDNELNQALFNVVDRLRTLKFLGRAAIGAQIIAEFVAETFKWVPSAAIFANGLDAHLVSRNMMPTGSEPVEITDEMVNAYRVDLCRLLTGDGMPAGFTGGETESYFDTVWNTLSTIPLIARNGSEQAMRQLNAAIRAGLEHGLEHAKTCARMDVAYGRLKKDVK